MSKSAPIISIKARDMRVGDRFTGFGTVQSFVIEDGKVWAQIPTARKAKLFAFDADMDIRVRRAVSA